MVDLEKKFDNACNTIFNNSMKITNEINVFLTQFGANKIIEKYKNKFVSTTLFTCLYYFSIVLVRTKEYDDEMIKNINYALITEMWNRIDQPFEVVEKNYSKLKRNLDDLPKNPKFQGENPFVLASMLYLQVALCDEFDTRVLDDNEYERFFVGLANSFMNILKSDFGL